MGVWYLDRRGPFASRIKHFQGRNGTWGPASRKSHFRSRRVIIWTRPPQNKAALYGSGVVVALSKLVFVRIPPHSESGTRFRTKDGIRVIRASFSASD